MKCATKWCRGKKAKRHRHCHKCIQLKWRTKNPLRYCYNTLRSNAKRRGKHFTLTFEEFKTFVDANNYMELKGRTKMSLTIDRKVDELGYSFENIQAITLSENVTKENFRRKHADVPF